MGKVINLYNKFEETLLVSSLVFNVIIVFTQVIMRSVFNYSLSWTEELSRYIFIWQTWLGASLALKYDEHIKVELIFSFLKGEKITKLIKITANLIWFVFCLFLVENGWELTQSMISRNALSSGMRIPLALIYVSLPISSLLICLRLISRFISDIKTRDNSLDTEVIRKGRDK